MSRFITEAEQALIDIIKPLNTAKWKADYRWDMLESAITKLGEDYGSLDMCPDFQRGHVWTPDQQRHYIENCLRGVVSSAGLLIQFSCSSWAEQDIETDLPSGLLCLDGLQRFTAITEFAKGNIMPFGLTMAELDGTQFGIKRFYVKVAIHSFTRRADLLENYLALNAGGTQHSPDEIARVRALLAKEKELKGSKQ